MSDGCGHRSGWDFLHGTCNGCGAVASTLYEEMREEAEGYKARIAELEGRDKEYRRLLEEIIDDYYDWVPVHWWRAAEELLREGE